MGKKVNKLPKKLSDVIEVAVADVKSVARSKKYVLDLNFWHKPTETQKQGEKAEVCRVCFAGSVIAKSLGGNPQDFIEPDFFDEHTGMRLEALNDVRCGNIIYALVAINAAELKIDKYLRKYSERENFLYMGRELQAEDQRKAFYKDMKRVVKQLREFGL